MSPHWKALSPRAAALAALLTGSACTLAHPARGTGAIQPEGKLITEEQIERSGATNAWEVLKRMGAHLSLGENRRGEPIRVSRRGQSSLYLDDSPLVVLNGIVMSDFQSLQQVPAETISSIRILAGIVSTRYYGTGSGGGAILIQTKTGPDQ
jgi:outer membrane cobalamin receptor